LEPWDQGTPGSLTHRPLMALQGKSWSIDVRRSDARSKAKQVSPKDRVIGPLTASLGGTSCNDTAPTEINALQTNNHGNT
jgi:hypothetical protein